MADDALVGAVLDGRYQVIEPIAKGAMGTVYRGERVGLGRAVAIKMMHEKLPSEMAARKRFEVEAKAMAQLEHPHCVPVFDVGVHDGKPYIVMELVRGKNLRDLIDEVGVFTRARAVSIVKQVLSGLAHAHELGIIHRDIKPPNIVVSQKSGIGEHVRILDFGLARSHAHSSGLTMGFAVGTPAYMAPEQCAGMAVTPRTDLYAVGVVLFELLVGRRPFEHADPLETVRMHLSQPPPRLADIRAEDFGSLEAIVARALAKQATDRFEDAHEMAAALEELAGPHVTGPVKAIVATPSGKIVDPNDQSSIPLGTDDIVASAPIQYPSTLPGFDPPIVGKRTPVAGTAAIPDSKPPESPRRPSDPKFLGKPPVIAPEPVPPPEPSDVFDASAAIRASSGTSGRRVVLAILLLAVLAAGAGIVFASGWLTRDQAATTRRDEIDPGISIAAQASALAQQGKLDAAIDHVATARATYPASSALAYRAGRLYCQRESWSPCLAAFRDAIRLEPGYREDADLIRDVVRGFTTALDPDPLATFLQHTIGKPASRALEDVARSHRSPKVRSRAAALRARLE